MSLHMPVFSRSICHLFKIYVTLTCHIKKLNAQVTDAVPAKWRIICSGSYWLSNTRRICWRRIASSISTVFDAPWKKRWNIMPRMQIRTLLLVQFDQRHFPKKSLNYSYHKSSYHKKNLNTSLRRYEIKKIEYLIVFLPIFSARRAAVPVRRHAQWPASHWMVKGCQERSIASTKDRQHQSHARSKIVIVSWNLKWKFV